MMMRISERQDHRRAIYLIAHNDFGDYKRSLRSSHIDRTLSSSPLNDGIDLIPESMPQYVWRDPWAPCPL